MAIVDLEFLSVVIMISHVLINYLQDPIDACFNILISESEHF